MEKTEEINIKCKMDALQREEESIYKQLSVFTFPEGFYLSMKYIIYQILVHIKEHALCKKVGIKIVMTKKKVKIDIVDDGVGLKQSYLNSGIYISDDRQAIEMAVAGVSTKKSNERAFGLSSVRKLAEQLGGIFNIEAGKAKAKYQKDICKFYSRKKILKGVNIQLELPVKKIRFYEIIR